MSVHNSGVPCEKFRFFTYLYSGYCKCIYTILLLFDESKFLLHIPEILFLDVWIYYSDSKVIIYFLSYLDI